MRLRQQRLYAANHVRLRLGRRTQTKQHNIRVQTKQRWPGGFDAGKTACQSETRHVLQRLRQPLAAGGLMLD
jgi:hypothetical protein